MDAGNYDSYNEKIRYDKNGNIKKLQRNGYLDGHTPYQIDDLEYNYSVLKPNTLDAVNDLSNSFDGFKDSNQLNKDYFYDTNGNMTHDSNKDIDIRYNHLNLPTHIAFNNTNNQGDITYTCNAVGAKVSKLVVQQSAQSQTFTEYLAGGFQYIDSRLEIYATPEGYVNVTEDQLYNYVYNYTDHLGNMRLSYTFDQELQELAVLQENHYYPFGMKHSNYGVSETDYLHDETTGQIYAVIEPVASNKFKYKYQGQERQDELGLNWDSFKWRNYDYAIGRFMSIDPLAETYSYQSPYNFAENRVVDGNELEGLEWVDAKGLKVYDPSLNDGKGGFTSSATSDHRNLAKSINQTATGRAQFNTLVNSTIPTETILDNTLTPKSSKGGLILASTVPTGVKEATEFDLATGKSEVVDVTVEKMTITFYAKNIDEISKDANDGDGLQPTGYGKVIPAGFNFSDIIGAIFGHEIGHTTKENVITEANRGDVEKAPTAVSNKIIDETSERKSK